MMSMYMWLAQVADKLEQAGIQRDEVAIAISEYQEKKLREELAANGSVVVQSLHHCEFMGWRVIVKGDNT